MSFFAYIDWQPGIGDPSCVGWVITVLYLFVAALSLVSGLRAGKGARGRVMLEVFWFLLAFFLLFLGVNKQLDLQSLLIETGREAAKHYGLYGQRRAIQRIFVILFTIAGGMGLFFVGRVLIHDYKRYRLLFVGLLVLGAFIVLRAASMSHVGIVPDAVRSIGMLRMKYVMELTGITLAGAGVLYYMRHK